MESSADDLSEDLDKLDKKFDEQAKMVNTNAFQIAELQVQTDIGTASGDQKSFCATN